MADRAGCGQWRIGWPEHFINMTGRADSASLTKMVLHDSFYEGITTIKLQRQATTQQKEFLSQLVQLKKKYGFKLIYEVDDVVFREEIPDYNVFKKAFDNDEIRQNCVDMINMVDEVTVPTDFMRKLYQEKTGKQEITVIPNFPPYWWIGHQYNLNRLTTAYENNKKKPRILYAGSAAHFNMDDKDVKDDFYHINEFIIRNLDKYQFIFIGEAPKPLRQYIFDQKIEIHKWCDLMTYPTYLSKLNAQLMLAPLANNSFNKSKSDIKFIEAACLGVPCLCQDMETYNTAPEPLRFSTVEELEYKVEYILNWKNRSKYFKMIPELRTIGSTRFLELEHNIGCHLEAMDTPYGSPERKFLRAWNP